MITIHSETHSAQLLRHLREQRKLTRRELARRLFVSNVTVANREYGVRGVHVSALVDTAHVLGYSVALIPRQHARSTGTGWPG